MHASLLRAPTAKSPHQSDISPLFDLFWAGFREQIKAGPEGSGMGLILLGKFLTLHKHLISPPTSADTISLLPAPLIPNRPPPAEPELQMLQKFRTVRQKSQREPMRGKSCPATVERWRESRARVGAARVRTKLVETWKNPACIYTSDVFLVLSSSFVTHFLFFSHIRR